MAEAHFPIQTAARLSGVTVYAIRIWEQRYGALEPRRTASNRRLYSHRDVEKLSLLKKLTGAGYNISQIATLPNEKLRKMAGAPPQSPLAASPGAESPAEILIADCLVATRALDAAALGDALSRAENTLGGMGMLQRVVAPLAQRVGDLWREGAITAAHEHFASAALRVHLGQASRPFGSSESAPVLVVATPAGQVHELGAMLVAAVAANLGWRVTYLGASLPAPEIAAAARQKGARAVALSLVYPEDDPALERELVRLREKLPPEIKIIAGGRAMPAYSALLQRLGIVPVESLAALGSALDNLRRDVAIAA